MVAERDIGDGDPNVVAGNVSAGSGDISFEVIPPQYVSPPGLTEQQRAEFEQAERTPLSPIPSNHGDDNASEATMTMLKLMQQNKWKCRC